MELVRSPARLQSFHSQGCLQVGGPLIKVLADSYLPGEIAQFGRLAVLAEAADPHHWAAQRVMMNSSPLMAFSMISEKRAFASLSVSMDSTGASPSQTRSDYMQLGAVNANPVWLMVPFARKREKALFRGRRAFARAVV